MTERTEPTPAVRPPPAARARKARVPKGRLRTTAWVAAGASFVAPWVALVHAPAPVAAASTKGHPRVIIVRRTIRRVVITAAAQAPVTSSGAAPRVRYVYVGGGTTTVSGGGGSTGTTRCSGC